MAAPSPRLLLLAVALVTCLALQRGDGADGLCMAPTPSSSCGPAGGIAGAGGTLLRPRSRLQEKVRRGSDPIHNRC
ncbi:unnamed protein product [Spirodela intermedia]|uniref:Uncharacterized protein n=1 Tax=Spirodela intermedia TaxID=51605 RepID=A0ABN7E9E2_SPIIN|nr:unnamed protein product [Spirodela intermedia]